MTRARFLEERRVAWNRFAKLLRVAERVRIRSMSGEDVSEFSRLFRAVCYDLATVRSREWGRDLELFLNDLVLRGHNCFYRASPGRIREILRFFAHEFPRLFRANLAYFWVALLLSLGPGLASGFLVANDASVASRLVPGEMLEAFEWMYGNREGDRSVGEESHAAGFYVWNNVGIAFQCFATGLLFGAGTLFILVQNGIFIGAITGYIVAKGLNEAFFTFTIGHGSFELTAIVIAGAAGLILGRALIHPGQLTRGEALRRRGRVAVQLAAGAAAMLGVAALIEAFWSPRDLPPAVKYWVGGGLWLVVFAYLTLAGRAESKA